MLVTSLDPQIEGGIQRDVTYSPLRHHSRISIDHDHLTLWVVGSAFCCNDCFRNHCEKSATDSQKVKDSARLTSFLGRIEANLALPLTYHDHFISPMQLVHSLRGFLPKLYKSFSYTPSLPLQAGKSYHLSDNV